MDVAMNYSYPCLPIPRSVPFRIDSLLALQVMICGTAAGLGKLVRSTGLAHPLPTQPQHRKAGHCLLLHLLLLGQDAADCFRIPAAVEQHEQVLREYHDGQLSGHHVGQSKTPWRPGRAVGTTPRLLVDKETQAMSPKPNSYPRARHVSAP